MVVVLVTVRVVLVAFGSSSNTQNKTGGNRTSKHIKNQIKLSVIEILQWRKRNKKVREKRRYFIASGKRKNSARKFLLKKTTQN